MENFTLVELIFICFYFYLKIWKLSCGKFYENLICENLEKITPNEKILFGVQEKKN